MRCCWPGWPLRGGSGGAAGGGGRGGGGAPQSEGRGAGAGAGGRVLSGRVVGVPPGPPPPARARRGRGEGLGGRWLAMLAGLAGCAARPGAGGHTPTDFTLTTLTQDQVEKLEAAVPGLAEVWPLPPLAEGLLFHATFDEQGPDVYVGQRALVLSGALDAGRLRASWEVLLARHVGLRGGFRRVEGGQPGQGVAGGGGWPWRGGGGGGAGGGRRGGRGGRGGGAGRGGDGGGGGGEGGGGGAGPEPGPDGEHDRAGGVGVAAGPAGRAR